LRKGQCGLKREKTTSEATSLKGVSKRVRASDHTFKKGKYRGEYTKFSRSERGLAKTGKRKKSWRTGNGGDFRGGKFYTSGYTKTSERKRTN